MFSSYPLNCTCAWVWVLIFLTVRGETIGLHSPEIITAGPTYNSYQFNILEHLTAISPHFESNANELNPDPPQGCVVDKAIYLVRHGSIYANDYDYEHTILPFLERLKDSSNAVDFSKSVDLAFLTVWTSPITDSDEQLEKLTKSGGLEAFNLGTQLAYRYPNLVPDDKRMAFKVWASASNRTNESASALLAGLFGDQETNGQIISISEGKNLSANTLTPTKTCSQFNISAGSEQADIWLTYYTASIMTRLNAKNSGFLFSAEDILAMQELCGYEIAIRGSSPFCGIFTPEEWLSFEYYFDIKYYYSFGHGNDLSPSLGMPWVVASSDLLNYTTPMDQSLYISLVHREMPPFILTALGLYNDSYRTGITDTDAIFPLDQINYHRAWKSSKFVPFLSHVGIERLQCTSNSNTDQFVRILVNSEPQPLPGCAKGPGASCPLAQYMDYVKNQDELYDDFSKACKINYQGTTDMLTFY